MMISQSLAMRLILLMIGAEALIKTFSRYTHRMGTCPLATISWSSAKPNQPLQKGFRFSRLLNSAVRPQRI
jgi:hypothetical protein